MLKSLTILLAAVTLAGCGKVGRVEANLTGYSESCIAGVAYLQFSSGVTVAYLPDGKVKNCK